MWIRIAVVFLLVVTSSPALAQGPAVRADSLTGREHFAADGAVDWHMGAVWVAFADWLNPAATVYQDEVFVFVRLSVGMIDAPSYYEARYTGVNVVGQVVGIRTDGTTTVLVPRMTIKIKDGLGSATKSFAIGKMRGLEHVVFVPKNTRRNKTLTALYWNLTEVYLEVVSGGGRPDAEGAMRTGPPTRR